MRSQVRRRTPSGATSVTIVGAGSLGSALAAELARAGWRVTLWSRRLAPTARIARALGARAERELAPAVARSNAVVLCVRDEALDELVTRLRELGRARTGAVVVHTSGARARAVLAPLARLGWHTAALHPLVARAALERGRSAALLRVPRCGWALETDDPRAARAARSLARACDGGEVFELSSKASERADYHLAATLLSNGALALFDVVLADVLPRSLRGAAHRRAFAQLLAHTASNLGAASEASRALTGPVARGDRSTLRAHLARLRGRPAAKELYSLLSARLVQLARRSGRLDAARAREVERLLKPSRTRSVGSARSRR